MRQPIHVLLVDDHDILRGGLAVFLEAFDDLQLVGEAVSGLEAVELWAELHPDVVLMDLVMPEMDGISATKIIREQYPDIKVIALTSFDEAALFQAALDAGVSSYLLKNVSIDELAASIRSAFAANST